VACHIASHPVTVTPRDTPPSHVTSHRPLFRGPCECDTGGKEQKGGIHLVSTACLLIFNASRFARSIEEIFPDQQRESHSAFSYFASLRCLAVRRLTSELPTAFALPCASRPYIGLQNPSHKSLRHSETDGCRHVSHDQKGVFARVANHVFHSVEAVRRGSQAPAKRLNRAICMDRTIKDPGGGPPGGDRSRPRINRPSLNLTRRLSAKVRSWPSKSGGGRL
jgi:hypothetical protein